jgi:ubiquinone/menaquinone biosynthesis C-methylase UbiE
MQNLKQTIASYWNKETCGTKAAVSPKYTKEYFDEIEKYRYKVEPEIFSFARFDRYKNCKILEIGVGAGTDFVQWVKAGAESYGVDLTESAIEHTKTRLELLGLSARDVRVADAENLPYPDNYFDLVYSWGVLHHTCDFEKSLGEAVRCTRVGGTLKIMVYNRRSLRALYKYIYFSLRHPRSFNRSIADVMYYHQESPGTRAFSIPEMRNILSKYPVEIKSINARATNYDLLWDKPLVFRFFAYVLAYLVGFNKSGWFMMVEMKKKSAH